MHRPVLLSTSVREAYFSIGSRQWRGAELITVVRLRNRCSAPNPPSSGSLSTMDKKTERSQDLEDEEKCLKCCLWLQPSCGSHDVSLHMTQARKNSCLDERDNFQALFIIEEFLTVQCWHGRKAHSCLEDLVTARIAMLTVHSWGNTIMIQRIIKM